MGLTEAQLAERRHYLGGTDMARLAGVSRYGGPLAVWLEKTGQSAGKPANPQMAMGTLLEPVVATLFSTATGMVLRRPPAKALRDRRRPWLGGNVDRYASPGTRLTPEQDAGGPYLPGIFEAKWATSDRDWGPTHPLADGLAQVPAGYAVQVQHYLGITGRPVAYMAVMLGYADFRWYALPRDEGTIDVLRQLGDRFWRDNVLAGVPPEPDGTKEYGRWLRERWAAEAGAELVATNEQQQWAEQLGRLDAELATIGQVREVVAQRLQKAMGTATKLLLPSGTISWAPYDENRVEWQAVADELAADLSRVVGVDSALDRYAQAAAGHLTTTTKRPFRPHLEEVPDADPDA